VNALNRMIFFALALAAVLSLLGIEIEMSITQPQIAYAFEGQDCWKQHWQDANGVDHWYWDCLH
jgi:hypothetical protein